jgi:hypothetical protein
MSAQAIDDFWRWWATANSEFASAFTAREGLREELVEAMSRRVSAIHESLDWEFGPGVRSEHHLCLSGKGDPLLRLVAERWVKRGPGADATWEFYASRQASRAGGQGLRIGGHDVDLDDFRYAVEEDESRETLDVRAHHPVFRAIADERLRRQILFIALDNLLGEDGVERWIGSIHGSIEPVSPAVAYTELPARIEQLASRATGERWAILKGEREGKPIFVTTNLALKRIDHLLLDMHLVVDLPLLEPTEHGLTTNEEADALNALEDELVASLGEHAVLAGRETCAGHRAIHLRVMEGGPARGLVERWAARHPERAATVDAKMDPRWDALRAWR